MTDVSQGLLSCFSVYTFKGQRPQSCLFLWAHSLCLGNNPVTLIGSEVIINVGVCVCLCVCLCVCVCVLLQQGQLAKELDFVSHHVRTKLDELKRQEVNRLRTLIRAKQDMEGGKGTSDQYDCVPL